MTSLNPVFTIGKQISEAIIIHQHVSEEIAREKTIEMLKLVGISNPEKRYYEYPHQISGGMRQRVMIAMALSCNPKLLIADEPTTALDVTIQAQILELISQLKEKIGMSVLLITHDLGVVAEMAERVIVMYAGQIVEEAKVEDLCENPLHPYTKGLRWLLKFCCYWVNSVGNSITHDSIN
ncbi:Oligopeptide transport ATP-binding protein OppD [Thermovenabulum gondwanense]|uniref:Oligopeptide transport ATP-binding protein OppD n=1 Tax=Thermovenabulum gondwanense TaxID=520767 RepID=A0A162M7P3_9FIRM|nr:ABC transporter ATP-binding protein [Thermovenabulum gondwanense]KYO64472.1 Oligopeptide transport ATP-binding protein OppD [Thermovenabulum gondwanense]